MSSLSEKHQELLESVITYTSDETFQNRAERQEAKEVLNWALEKLPAADRMVVELVFLEGLSVGEAADLLGWSMANVKVRSFRARRKLRTLLSKFMEEGKDI
jgi:RNA polymerase sigma-70 factor (ECF subfamily)